jgi:hypothetical protein
MHLAGAAAALPLAARHSRLQGCWQARWEGWLLEQLAAHVAMRPLQRHWQPHLRLLCLPAVQQQGALLLGLHVHLTMALHLQVPMRRQLLHILQLPALLEALLHLQLAQPVL